MMSARRIVSAPLAALAMTLTLGCDEPAEFAPEVRKAAPLVPEAAPLDERCDEACSPDARCCTEVFRHGSGASVGWLRRAAPIAVPVAAEPDLVLAAFKRWLVEHPAVAGLDAMADETPLAGLTPWPTPPRSFGALTTIRLEQHYRGVTVVGAGETVTLTLSPRHGVIAVHGAIADARELYAGWDDPISPAAAIAAADELLTPAQAPGQELDPVHYSVADPTLVAVVEVKAMAYRMRLLRDSAEVGTLMVRANNGAMLEMSFDTAEAPPDPTPITVRGRTFQSNTYALHDASQQFVADMTHLNGVALQGSIYMPLACQMDPEASPQCGETRLGNHEVTVIDGLSEPYDKQTALYAPTSASGEFLAQPPTMKDDPHTPETRAAALQDAFYRLLATFRLFAPLKAGRWDSALGVESNFPAGEFVPRLVYFFDLRGVCKDQPGCASLYFPDKKVGGYSEYDEHPWTDLPAHRFEAGPAEGMGRIISLVESNRSVDLLFHEFGHFLDLFTARDMIGNRVVGSGCTGPEDKMCQPACVPDSTDESDPLKETLADFMGVYAIARLYTGLTYDNHCGAITQISNSGKSTPVHGPTCVTHADQIHSFLDDRPTKPGYNGSIPTGKCLLNTGYRQGALLTAWWEWIHGQQCAVTAPFTCTTFGEQAFGASTGAEAMLYALSLTNATYYRMFLTDAETYLQCMYGDGLGARWREVWCHHDGLDCAAMPSPCPALCGDGVAQGDEACDQTDLAGTTCEALGHASGALSCNQNCTLNITQCVPAEAPTTGEAPTSGAVPTSDGDGPVSGSNEASSDPSPDSATAGGVADDEGCGCATTAIEGAWLLGITPLLLRRRRRRRVLDNRPTQE